MLYWIEMHVVHMMLIILVVSYKVRLKRFCQKGGTMFWSLLRFLVNLRLMMLQRRE